LNILNKLNFKVFRVQSWQFFNFFVFHFGEFLFEFPTFRHVWSVAYSVKICSFFMYYIRFYWFIIVTVVYSMSFLCGMNASQLYPLPQKVFENIEIMNPRTILLYLRLYFRVTRNVSRGTLSSETSRIAWFD
jgi:hypothetical protein